MLRLVDNNISEVYILRCQFRTASLSESKLSKSVGMKKSLPSISPWHRWIHSSVPLVQALSQAPWDILLPWYSGSTVDAVHIHPHVLFGCRWMATAFIRLTGSCVWDLLSYHSCHGSYMGSNGDVGETKYYDNNSSSVPNLPFHWGSR